jgi:hypothetical protein
VGLDAGNMQYVEVDLSDFTKRKPIFFSFHTSLVTGLSGYTHPVTFKKYFISYSENCIMAYWRLD